VEKSALLGLRVRHVLNWLLPEGVATRDSQNAESLMQGGVRFQTEGRRRSGGSELIPGLPPAPNNVFPFDLQEEGSRRTEVSAWNSASGGAAVPW